jgi:hypothetical protein
MARQIRFQPLAEILPPVARDENHTRVAGKEIERPLEPVGSRAHLLDLHQQRVDDRVAHHVNRLLGHILRAESGAAPFGRREMPIGERGRQAPVHLLGEGGKRVAGAQAGLDVRDLDPPMEGCKRAGERCRRVALNDDDVGRDLDQHIVEAGEYPCGETGKRLVRRHQVEIIVRFDPEQIEHLVQHLAVLSRRADLNPNIFSAR